MAQESVRSGMANLACLGKPGVQCHSHAGPRTPAKLAFDRDVMQFWRKKLQDAQERDLGDTSAQRSLLRRVIGTIEATAADSVSLQPAARARHAHRRRVRWAVAASTSAPMLRCLRLIPFRVCYPSAPSMTLRDANAPIEK
jgi:hypothetical protein